MRLNMRNRKYLLRFDDICPTMNWEVWSDIEADLEERNLKPILAVVPDNQDQILKVNPPARDFWERVRTWQARGWTIALHGYQHKYVICHRGIVTVKKKSEFAGVPPGQQEEKLRRGLEIFRREGIKSHLWIAPSNSFDSATVSLLAGFGISIICDGCFRFPFVCRKNMFWVPQQLFSFRPAPPGVWTVCYHHNRWTSDDLRRFREDLDRYGPEISSLNDIAREWGGRHSWWSSFFCTSPRLSSILTRGQLKLWGWWKTLIAKTQPSVKPLSSLQLR
jgi:uncharacterized protein DUF2334